MFSNIVNDMSKMKIANILLILRTVYNTGSLSRSELTQLTGLSSSAVTSLTKDLLKKKIIIEKPPKENCGVGRPRKPLAINSKEIYVIGTHISGKETISLILFNLKGEKIEKINFNIDNYDPENIINLLVDGLKNLKKEFPHIEDKIIGFGIGISGIVDNKNGICKYSENLGWSELDLKIILQDKIDIPFLIERDVNALGLAEYMRLDEKFDPLAVLMIENGIGLGLIINGSIYSGHLGGAGEISHMVELNYQNNRRSGLTEQKYSLANITSNTGKLLKLITETYDPSLIIFSSNYEIKKNKQKQILNEYEEKLALPGKFKKDIIFKRHSKDNWSWGAASVVIHDFLNNQSYWKDMFN